MSTARQRARVTELLGETLLDTRWVRRLGRISFLGTLDRHPRSRRASSRLEHSIGVAALAADAAEALELPRERARVFVAACLLHDVGHYPLSHAAEPAFAQVLGAGHHEVGRWIVLGEGPIPRARSLRPTLEALDIDPEALWAIVDRSPELPAELAPLAELLKAPINLDTLEGINRVARDFRLRKRRLPERIFAWAGGELGIAAAALPAIDRFWALKHQVYDRIINLPSNILAEARLCELVSDNIDAAVLEALDHFDDPALRRKLGPEKLERAALVGREDRDYELWVSSDYGEIVDEGAAGPSGAGGREPLMVRVRKRYWVDRAVEAQGRGKDAALPLSAWPERYRHEKSRAWLVSRRQDQLQLPLPAAAFAGAKPSSEAPEI